MNKLNKTISNYNKSIDDIIDLYIDKFFTYGNNGRAKAQWIHYDIGIVHIGDYFFNIKDIISALQLEQCTQNDIIEYYDFCYDNHIKKTAIEEQNKDALDKIFNGLQCDYTFKYFIENKQNIINKNKHD